MTFQQFIQRIQRKLFFIWLAKDISENQELFDELAFEHLKKCSD